MTQIALNIMHDETMDKIQMYASGLITLLELQNALVGFGLTFEKVDGFWSDIRKG